ncbi:jg8883 [Pararge aegeria aegeria]|uniref:Jg8883 protein n=3 Tax=Pararge aegeria TaxID=116150 RepID=A0A8S4R3H0_9NEOP|nr:jg8883 [Pararge aegeria aegeria]
MSLNDTTKASLWIESRKTPRALPRMLPRALPRSEPRSVKKSTPLRLAVLKKAQSAHKMRVTKIQAPSKIVLQSPNLPRPKKSALKKSSAKKSTRKTESIKFDLSNLENPEDRPSDVVILMDTTKEPSYESASEEDVLLRYSDSSRSPSPRRSIHSRSSRSSRILEKSLGDTYANSPSNWSESSLSESARLRKSPSQSKLESPRHRKSSRGSIIVEKALESSFDDSQYTHGTKSFTDQSYITTVASTRKSVTRSPRATNQKLESYSIVDLVSMDSTGSDRSVYGSAGSESSTVPYATPRAGRSTRANNSSLLSSSTPYADKTQGSHPVSPDISVRTRRSSSLKGSNRSRNSTVSKRRSASLTTPENTQTRITINSTRISRASRSRSRINDSDVLLMDDDDASPKSSRRISKSSLASPVPRKNITITETPGTASNGTSTPENKYSPEEATTPMLSIQNFLEQSSLSQSSLSSQRSLRRREGVNFKRKTIAGERPQSKKFRTSIKSRSLIASARRSLRALKTSLNTMDPSQDLSQDEEDVTTPKSAVKPIQEGVKNKHSSAKKPQSKRSIIDNLDESDFVKQLFNSPVKRKLSRSMTEFSRKKLFEEDDDVRAPTRNTIAVLDRTPDNSIMDHTEAFTPDVFISPLSTPGNSPNIAGLKRFFHKTPEKSVLQIRTRRSIKNDLTDVAGVKQVFAKSPRNRLSDVRVKEVFGSSPENDLRRVTGVKDLFRSARKQKSPKNSLQDVKGVKELFKNSVSNDLLNVSGVKTVLRVNSPRNNLSDVRGVKQLYRETVDGNNLSDVSGVDELFREGEDLDTTFDQLIGKPPVRAYTKSRSFTKVVKSKQRRNAKSLHDSISLINENVEEWLQNELKKRVHKEDRKSTSKTNLTRELQKLNTDTVQGSAPLQLSRSRNVTMTRSINSEDNQSKKSASEIYSTHMLPIKKRSLVEVTRGSNIQKLPIKKRMVVHSTPVKGRVNITMNASELGRVSPIANVMTIMKTTDITTTGLPQRELSKLIRGKIFQTDEEILTTEQLSPKMPMKLSPKIPSPNKASPKMTRASRASSRNKRRASFVITKKKPVLSPKPNKETSVSRSGSKNIEDNPKSNRPTIQTQVKDKLSTPKLTRAKKTLASGAPNRKQSETKKTTRSTRRHSQNKEIPKTPKNTRAKATKTTVVVTKPPTQLKLNTNSKIIAQETNKTGKTRVQQDTEIVLDLTIEEKQTRRTRNAKIADIKTIVKKPKGKTFNSNITEEIKESKQNKRGRNIILEAEPKPATKRGVAAKSASIADIVEGPKGIRNKNTTILPHSTIGSKTTSDVDKASSIATVESKTRRGARSKNVTFKDEPIRNSKSKSVQSEEKNSRVTRGKKSEGAEETVKKGKNIAKDTVKKGKNSDEDAVKKGKNSPKDIVKRGKTSKETVKRGKKTVEDNPVNEPDPTAVRRTRQLQSDKRENTVKKGINDVPTVNIAETTVGRKTRNALKANETVKETTKKGLEDIKEGSSKVKRNRNVTEKEVPVENTRGRKVSKHAWSGVHRGYAQGMQMI